MEWLVTPERSSPPDFPPTNLLTQGKTLDVVTLFHAPSVPASIRAQSILKQASAEASETSTIDQAADHSAQNKVQRSEFELEVTEEAPTEDQLKSILEYLNGGSPGAVVQGATSVSDALKKIKSSPSAFQRPVVR